jgi:hypothetical protein
LHAKAVDWVERNPYEVMFMACFPALDIPIFAVMHNTALGKRCDRVWSLT